MNAPVHPHDLARHNANEPYEPAPGDAAYVDPARYAEGFPAEGFAPQEQPQEQGPSRSRSRRCGGSGAGLRPVQDAARQERAPRLPRGDGLCVPLRHHRRAAGAARAAPRSADRLPARRRRDLRRAPRYRRPQRRDPRDRRQDRLGVRRAAPHRRQGRGGRAADGGAARPQRPRAAREARPASAASSGSSARSRPSSSRRSTASAFPASASAREQARLSRTGRSSSHVSARPTSTTRASPGIEKYIDEQGLAALNMAGFATDQADLKPVQLSIDLRVQHAMRDELLKGMEKFKAKAAGGVILDVNTGEVLVARLAARLRPEQPGRCARPEPDQPHRRRRVRDGLDLQDAHHRDGARLRQGQHQFDASTRAAAAVRRASPSTTSTPPGAC